MNQPLSQDEFLKLLQAMEMIVTSIDRMLSQGVVVESFDDERIKSSQDRMDTYRNRIEKERKRVQTLKRYLTSF